MAGIYRGDAGHCPRQHQRSWILQCNAERLKGYIEEIPLPAAHHLMGLPDPRARPVGCSRQAQTRMLQERSWTEDPFDGRHGIIGATGPA